MIDIILAHWPTAMAMSLSLLATSLYWAERQSRRALEARFSVIVDADREARKIVNSARAFARKQIAEANSLANATRSEAGTIQKETRLLQQQYAEKRAIYDRLVKEVAIFDDRLAFAELGLYEPHFEFSDSERFKTELIKVREQQKSLVTSDRAVICRTEWAVQGSRSKGRTMTNRNIKLTVRAFNGECDAAISNVRWNNAVAAEGRIKKVREKIDRLNESNTISITEAYLQLKLRELRLTHEYREKLKQEKDDRAEAARLAREEQRLLRDLENAKDEEIRYEALVAKAKAEAARTHGARLEAFTGQIKSLERDLAEARARVQRAQSMAERTSSGYVYIISNVGSFGEDVIKIGLTRRLDPMDRVRELGDASVPFVFDTHAIIYSDSAPALERALHSEFDALRINMQNSRKEFFRVRLDAVESAVKRLAPGATFFKDIEAQEYHETLARRHADLTTTEAAHRVALPVAI